MSLQSTIFSALAIVVQQHPVLSTVFINESPSKIFYGRLPEIDLSKIVTFVQRQKPYTGAGADLELDGLLEKQHDTGFEEMNGTAPFWRLMILTDSTASPKPSFAATFICHHSVGDGVFVVAFHKSFLAALQTINGSLSSTIVQSPKTPMLPTVEDVLKMPVSAKHFLKKVSSELFLPTSKNLWIAEPIKVLTTSHFQSVVISPDITSSFVARCKENDTTVTATIQTVIAAALFQLLPAKFSTLQCNLSVSLRRWLPDPINEKSIGCWASTVEEHYSRQAFSWNEARRTRQTTLKYLSSSAKNDVVGMLRFLPNLHAFAKAQIGKNRSSSFEVSNVGVFKADMEGNNWQLGRMVFSQSAFANESAFTVSVVTGADGSCVFGFTWPEGIVESDLMEKLIVMVSNDVEELADHGSLSREA